MIFKGIKSGMLLNNLKGLNIDSICEMEEREE